MRRNCWSSNVNIIVLEKLLVTSIDNNCSSSSFFSSSSSVNTGFSGLYRNMKNVLLLNLIVDKCFGPQCKSHVVGFGAGITAKELKGGNSSKTALLEMSNATEKEKESLKGRLEGLESKYDVLESKYV
uniref:Uncharacterized protein LOC104231079 n=1 Tax=Nicotiana sylvestris TaxID=4096 RepID=A0A1U7X752_NICSY|nr:PREDICTED: uncharacterized protein LOC104231079 [Nicotiana sylvestris]